MSKTLIRIDEEQVQRSARRLFALGEQAGLRMDEGESVFFARQLEHIIAQEFDIEYPELRSRALIPVTMEADPADTTVTYREYDRVGMAKLITDYSADLPRVDISGVEVTGQIKSLGDSYGYSLQEVRASAKTGRDLEGRRAEMAREAILRQENYISFFGDTTNKLIGFLNFANVTVATLAADGAGASKAWADKSADQILRDLNQVVNSITELTLGIEVPDTLVLPRKQFHIASTKRIGRDSNMTVMKFFLETNSYIKSLAQVEVLNEIATAGSGSTTRMMAFRRNPLKVRLEIPQDFESLPAQPKNLAWIVPCHSRTAAIIWHRPLSAVYADGL